MQFKKKLEIKANHKQVVIDVADILYIKASVNENFLSMKYKIDADDRIHELPYGCEPKAV